MSDRSLEPIDQLIQIRAIKVSVALTLISFVIILITVIGCCATYTKSKLILLMVILLSIHLTLNLIDFIFSFAYFWLFWCSSKYFRLIIVFTITQKSVQKTIIQFWLLLHIFIQFWLLLHIFLNFNFEISWKRVKLITVSKIWLSIINGLTRVHSIRAIH